MISDPAAAGLRRVFYEVEEPLEIHLSILSGVAERNETPFFDNLKKYAQKPVGTFHALPVARGKSIFKSNWIRDMGEFYGANLFLAESSATSGGLDSLLEPTGNIKKAQDAAARAFGADRVFFVTNGTSTSNKMVHQALLRAGRHRDRGSQLSQVAPLRDGAGGGPAVLRRGLPHGGVLDVRRRADAQPQEGPARSQGGGPARQGEDGHAHQLHLRRPRLRRAPRDGRVPGDQTGPDLPLGRGLVRLRPLLAALSAAHGDGRARGSEGGLRRPGVPGAVSRAGEAARRRPRPQGRARARHAAHPRSAQGQAAHLPDELDAQVDVGAATGLDGAGRRRGLPPARAGLQGSGVHARLDLSQPADHRVARHRAPADGVGGLRTGHAGHPARDRDSRRGEQASAGVQVLPGPGRRRHGAGRVPAIRPQELHRGRRHLGGCGSRLPRGRVHPRPDPALAAVRDRGLRRHAVQEPARLRVRDSAEQDLAQLDPAADQHQQHAQRRGQPAQGARRDLQGDRGASQERR